MACKSVSINVQFQPYQTACFFFVSSIFRVHSHLCSIVFCIVITYLSSVSAMGKGLAINKKEKAPKQSAADLQNAIADISGVLPKDVKVFLDTLRKVATQKLRETCVFKLHDIVVIRKKKNPERAELKRKMFGKEVVVPARPAVERITVQVVKPLYTSVQTAL